jgi:DNA helicase-2/ATP-dependent DNA helicase PcrA
MQNYLNELNEAQKQAVINTEGAVLVIAGAGSGKTRVLTYRIAHLLEKGVKPYKILALTFTNKAAREMKERIGNLIGIENAAALWMGTFHSIFAKILRFEAENLGYPKNFTIYDASDTKNIIKSIIKELQLDDTIYKPSGVYSRISGAKNNLITADAYEANKQARFNDEQSKQPEIYRIYKIYSQRCFNSGAMDFDDLLLKTNILFKNFPEILEKYQKKFNYILVDEYQDTNFSQYLIVKKLAESHKNVCVVGDDAQSIYSFRGAKIENILNFKKDYTDFKLFKLEQNYRSTQNIVDAANSVISKNKNQIQKEVFSKNEIGNKIKILQNLTDNEEGFSVANLISDSVYREHTEYKEHAILYRTNMQSRIFEEALRRRNIPYKIYGGTSFYQRKEIKDVLAYYKLVVNLKDDESLRRIINYPKRGIGDSTIDKLTEYATENNLSIWDAIINIPHSNIELNSRAVNQIFGFAEMINDFVAKLYITDAYDLAKEIAATSGILQDLFIDKAPEAIARHENVQELLNGIKEFTKKDELKDLKVITLDMYLEDVSLLTDIDNEKEEDRNKVTLMTIHSAKGLEFRNIYIVGVEERLFPSEMSAFSPTELEEERRLFYVAVTRAEKQLVISFAGQRYKWGQLNDCIPSRFIKEIDSQYLDYDEFENNDDNFAEQSNNSKPKPKSEYLNKYASYKKKPKSDEDKKPKISVEPSKMNRNLVKISNTSTPKISDGEFSSVEDIIEGVEVFHDRFGNGKVLKVEGSFPNSKATILFDSAGEKQLLLKFAKLKVV